ncbi:nucleotide-binding alpha-beta plait domain-containing protein [Tanacetum coccineum]
MAVMGMCFDHVDVMSIGKCCHIVGVGGYRNDITVGAAMILTNVSVFSPNPSKHYLNITMRNVVEVFRKDTVPGSGSVLEIQAQSVWLDKRVIPKIYWSVDPRGGVMAQEKAQEDDCDDAKGEEKRKFVPCQNMVNFFFTNFPSEWNTANLLELFEEVDEVADVYVAKKMSKVGQKFRFARFFRVGNLQALKNQLNRIRIGRFKLRANIARFERGHYKSQQGCNKVDWVFDIPPKSNWKATGNISPSKSQNGNLKYKDSVGESFLIHSISELQSIWQSFNTKDCKGGKIDTDEAIDLAQVCFDDKSGEKDASVREEPKSGVVTASETSSTSVLQSERKHLDFRSKAGSKYIVCEEIISKRKLKNGDEDDSKVDEMLSSSEVKEFVDGAHKHVESINIKSEGSGDEVTSNSPAKVNSSITISDDNGDHVRRKGDDGFFDMGVSDVEIAVRDFELVTEKVPLDTDVSLDFKIKPTVISDASTKKPVIEKEIIEKGDF